MTDIIVDLDATHMARLLPKGTFRPSKSCRRTSHVNPEINAIVILADGAINATGKAEAAVMLGGSL
jgi:hypothetical protein